MKIYHVPGTRSIRPIWLCFELDLAVDIESIDPSEDYRASPQWRAISPAGKIPALRDGELTMFESGAMVMYLLERYGQSRLQPTPGTAESAEFQQWCWFSEATLIRPLGLARMLRDSTDLDQVARQKTLEALNAVELGLEGREYLVAETFSAADIMMGYSLHLLEKFRLLTSEQTNTLNYLQRLRSRDACSRAFAV